jgi:hypothetical protein
MLVYLTPDQQALATAMSDISESSYSAGWMIGLEFALWYLLVTGKKSYGRYRLSEQESAIVHALLALRRLDRVRYEGRRSFRPSRRLEADICHGSFEASFR